jgi:hypothetical protein
MLKLFKNITYFSILFFSIILADILVKINYESIPLRLLTKSLIVGSLLFYYIVNNQEISKKKFFYMIIALSCFLIGDILIVFYNVTICFMLGMLLFVFGKIFYAFRFSNQKDFKLTRLIPFLVITFIYMAGLIWIVMII